MTDEPTRPGYGSVRDLPSFVELQRQLEGLKALTVLMGDDQSTVIKLERDLDEITHRVEAFYSLLGRRHWTYTDWMNNKALDRVVSERSPEGAEEQLIAMYQDSDSFQWQLMKLGNIPGLRERHHLLVRARADYDEGRFDSCTLLLIAVMDGFVNDFDSSQRKGMAARDPEDMVAWDSVSGHHLGLANALGPFLKTIKRRIDDEVFEVHRHGIVHGSVVNFNNVVVASKAWNMLFATVDWGVATRKKHDEDSKPPQPEPDLNQLLRDYDRQERLKAAFVPWEVTAGSADFSADPVLALTHRLVEAWQKKQWTRLVPLMPMGMCEGRSPGKAAVFVKGWFDPHTVIDVVVDRIEYPQSSVALAKGKATIDGRTSHLQIRWVRYADRNGLAFNEDEGTWQLAVIDPATYLVDENGDRLN